MRRDECGRKSSYKTTIGICNLPEAIVKPPVITTQDVRTQIYLIHQSNNPFWMPRIPPVLQNRKGLSTFQSTIFLPITLNSTLFISTIFAVSTLMTPANSTVPIRPPISFGPETFTMPEISTNPSRTSSSDLYPTSPSDVDSGRISLLTYNDDMSAGLKVLWDRDIP